MTLSRSKRHTRIHLLRWAGVTPKDFLQALTPVRARRLRAESRRLLDASLSLGLSGSGRLRDLFVSLEAMTPGEFKTGGAGVRVRWGIQPTPSSRA